MCIVTKRLLKCSAANTNLFAIYILAIIFSPSAASADEARWGGGKRTSGALDFAVHSPLTVSADASKRSNVQTYVGFRCFPGKARAELRVRGSWSADEVGVSGADQSGSTRIGFVKSKGDTPLVIDVFQDARSTTLTMHRSTDFKVVGEVFRLITSKPGPTALQVGPNIFVALPPSITVVTPIANEIRTEMARCFRQ